MAFTFPIPPWGTDDIENNAITNSKLAINAVSNFNLQIDAVKNNNIVNNAVTNSKLQVNSVSTDKIQDNSVTQSKIADNSITHEKLTSNSVGFSNIQPNSITSSMIRDLTVTNGKIQNNSISTNKIQSKAVDNTKLNDDSVGYRAIHPYVFETPTITGYDPTTITYKIIDGGTYSNIPVKSQFDNILTKTDICWERIGTRVFWTIEALPSTGPTLYIKFNIPEFLIDSPRYNCPLYHHMRFYQVLNRSFSTNEPIEGQIDVYRNGEVIVKHRLGHNINYWQYPLTFEYTVQLNKLSSSYDYIVRWFDLTDKRKITLKPAPPADRMDTCECLKTGVTMTAVNSSIDVLDNGVYDGLHISTRGIGDVQFPQTTAYHDFAWTIYVVFDLYLEIDRNSDTYVLLGSYPRPYPPPAVRPYILLGAHAAAEPNEILGLHETLWSTGGYTTDVIYGSSIEDKWRKDTIHVLKVTYQCVPGDTYTFGTLEMKLATKHSGKFDTLTTNHYGTTGNRYLYNMGLFTVVGGNDDMPTGYKNLPGRVYEYMAIDGVRDDRDVENYFLRKYCLPKF